MSILTFFPYKAHCAYDYIHFFVESIVYYQIVHHSHSMRLHRMTCEHGKRMLLEPVDFTKRNHQFYQFHSYLVHKCSFRCRLERKIRQNHTVGIPSRSGRALQAHHTYRHNSMPLCASKELPRQKNQVDPYLLSFLLYRSRIADRRPPSIDNPGLLYPGLAKMPTFSSQFPPKPTN